MRRALRTPDPEIPPGRGPDFFDPWGNRRQVVGYRDVRSTEAPEESRGKGLAPAGVYEKGVLCLVCGSPSSATSTFSS